MALDAYMLLGAMLARSRTTTSVPSALAPPVEPKPAAILPQSPVTTLSPIHVETLSNKTYTPLTPTIQPVTVSPPPPAPVIKPATILPPPPAPVIKPATILPPPPASTTQPATISPPPPATQPATATSTTSRILKPITEKELTTLTNKLYIPYKPPVPGTPPPSSPRAAASSDPSPETPAPTTSPEPLQDDEPQEDTATSEDEEAHEERYDNDPDLYDAVKEWDEGTPIFGFLKNNEHTIQYLLLVGIALTLYHLGKHRAQRNT